MDPPSSPCPPRHHTRATPESSLAPPSSPISRLSTTSTKSTKPPSITPRRFNRFFTPRSALQAQATTVQSAQDRAPLGDISTSGGNRRLAQSSPLKRHAQSQSRRLFDVDENGLPSSDQLDATPNRPSPAKRLCMSRPGDLHAEVASLNTLDIPSSPPSYPASPVTYQAPPKPIRKSAFRKAYGSALRREFDCSAATFKSTWAGICSTNTQAETANFCSTAEDFHHMYNPDYANSVEGAEPRTTPFCVAPCNTNSLAAIADEEGYVRMIETGKGQDPPMLKDYLHFRAHKNAILHLDFCEDDSLLATAAGDQTGQVIDMQTQKAVYTLWGHRSSLRQIRFQPGSGGKIVATSGRDGVVTIWDLRCTPVERPGPNVPTMAIGGGITTLDASGNRRYAQYKHQFTPPIPRAKDGSSANRVPNEKSVTAISFLSASNNYILSGSATGPAISLWDIRKMRLSAGSRQNALVGRATPNKDTKSTRGLLSISLSTDQSRIYALSRDSTAYVYSTASLLNEGSQIEALYGLRHKDMIVTSWYHSLAVRPTSSSRTELLAVAGVGGRVVLFPTNEDYMNSGLIKTDGVKNGVKMYGHGTVLGSGHSAEVSSVAWTNQGELCSVSDDFTCRVWREDDVTARTMRKAALANDGEVDKRYCGWAETRDNWDDEEIE